MTLDEMKRVAEAATPGARAWRGEWHGWTLVSLPEQTIVADPCCFNPQDEPFIATFDPPTVLALLAVVEAAGAGHRFPGHDCLPFTETADEGTSYCGLCEALAALGDL